MAAPTEESFETPTNCLVGKLLVYISDTLNEARIGATIASQSNRSSNTAVIYKIDLFDLIEITFEKLRSSSHSLIV